MSGIYIENHGDKLYQGGTRIFQVLSTKFDVVTRSFGTLSASYIPIEMGNMDTSKAVQNRKWATSLS